MDEVNSWFIYQSNIEELNIHRNVSYKYFMQQVYVYLGKGSVELYVGMIKKYHIDKDWKPWDKELVVLENIINTSHAYVRNGSTIYCIRDTITDSVKIGHTNNVKKRLSTLQCGNPNLLVLEDTIFGGRFSEQYVHNLLRNSKVRGEWFNISNDNIQTIFEKMRETYNICNQE